MNVFLCNLTAMCPHCRSDYLKIKKCEGMERVLVFLTGKRKYRCMGCTHVFREFDRRRSRRAPAAMAANFLTAPPTHK